MVFQKKGLAKLILILLAVGLLMFSSLACGGPAPEPSENGDATEAPQEAAQGEAKWISIATASTAGAWYPIGGGMAATISKHAPGLFANAETGAASLENIRNLIEDNVQIVFTQPDIAAKAYAGEDMYEGNPQSSLRGLMSSYSTVVHLVTVEGTGVNKIEDVRGKSVGVGAPGSGTEVFAKDLLQQHGITYDDISEQFLGDPDQVTGLKDGNVDLSITMNPVPTGVFTELAVTHKLNLLEISPEIQKNITETLPGFFNYTIQSGSYPGQENDVETVAYRGLIVTSSEMSEEDAYNIVKATWEFKEEWEDVHVVVNDMNVETAIEGMTVPLHPGAIKYYQEIGMDIPSELIP